MPDERPVAPVGERRDHLAADCERCFALCCMVPAFSASADFAIDKPAGVACFNLLQDFRCGIHQGLRRYGFPGCAVYDCFGAGQWVSQVTFGGRDWRPDPGTAALMSLVFPVVRRLHELLWHLREAIELPAAAPLRAELSRAFDETERLAKGGVQDLERLDLDAHWGETAALLRRASELARVGPGARRRPRDHSGADLVGKDLSGRDLRRASLRGASLVGAKLRGADLRGADFTGADLRGADLGGADLIGAIFLTQAQLDAATGDLETKLSPPRTRPAHWQATSPAGSPARDPRRRR